MKQTGTTGTAKQPLVKYYALLMAVECTKEHRETPKYAITESAGHYAPMEELKGRDGLVSFYLVEKISDKASAPAMRLQGKSSLPLTGLRDYFVDGRLSGFAYGCPPSGATFGVKNKKPNPFASYADDAFLFIVHQDNKTGTQKEQLVPTSIELLVLDGAKRFAPQYCKQLQMGGFDKELEQLRKQAKASTLL